MTKKNEFKLPQFFLNEEHILTSDVFEKTHDKILYPSAINAFYNMIKVLMKTEVTSKYSILSILKIRSSHLKNI